MHCCSPFMVHVEQSALKEVNLTHAVTAAPRSKAYNFRYLGARSARRKSESKAFMVLVDSRSAWVKTGCDTSTRMHTGAQGSHLSVHLISAPKREDQREKDVLLLTHHSGETRSAAADVVRGVHACSDAYAGEVRRCPSLFCGWA